MLLYFFFNGLFLPEGLLYTTLLTPVFLYISLREKLLKPYLWFFVLSVPIVLIHFYNGVNEWYYLRSYALLFCSFSFGVAFYLFATRSGAPDSAMKTVLIANTLLIPVALIAYFIGPLKEYFWYLVPISKDIAVIPRLKMLTYEASYYSLLWVPVFLYYFYGIVFHKRKDMLLLCVLLTVPLILSFSLGVIGGLAITLTLVYLLHLKDLALNNRFRGSMFIILGMVVCTVVALVLFFPDNPLFKRLQNIPTGEDTSARGRTYEALQLAWLMVQEKSTWFGIGLGQIKEMGRDTIIQFYSYTNMPDVARLPNTVAETLAQFGIVGLLFRFGVQLWLFVKTKVWSNYFRLSLFLFIFIYQFSGSFLINIAELVIWILAFAPVLPKFNKNVLTPGRQVGSG